MAATVMRGYPGGEGMYLLVVEDDAASLKLLTLVLRHAGHTMEGCATRRAALEAIDDRGALFGAAIIDVGLPDGSGVDVIRHLRRRLGPRIPVVVVTASVDPASRMAGEAAGCNHWLRKPIDTRQLPVLLESLRSDQGSRTT